MAQEGPLDLCVRVWCFVHYTLLQLALEGELKAQGHLDHTVLWIPAAVFSD